MTRSNGTPGRELVARTEERIGTLLEEKELALPPGYAWQNALKSAWLQLQDATMPFGPKKGQRLLDNVTEKSVANALLDMVVQGLNPAAKQGYFIPYGQTLTFQRSYFGSIAVAKRVAGVEDVRALVVYAGDELDLEVANGYRRIVSHRQTFESIRDGTIVGAYAIVDFRPRVTVEGVVRRESVVDVMTFEEIKQSWEQTRSKGEVHQKFPEEMARRTVIQRALKPIINTATDEYLFLDAYNRDGSVTVEAELAEELETDPVDVDLPDLAREAAPESLEELEEEGAPSETPRPPAEDDDAAPTPARIDESEPEEEPEPEPEPEPVGDGLPQTLPF